MKERLIKLLGGYTKLEYDGLADSAREQIADLQKQIEPRKFCSKTPGCAMEEGHGGGCREWHGLCFSTMHQHELRTKRAERDRKAMEELTGKPAGVGQ